MYIKTSPGSPPQQVTSNGLENEIFNGIPDWVYEGERNLKLENSFTPGINEFWILTLDLPEEMFSSTQGLWWSPGGRYVAYMESNDTKVHNIEYTWYGENQYPSTISIRYPKVGLFRA